MKLKMLDISSALGKYVVKNMYVVVRMTGKIPKIIDPM